MDGLEIKWELTPPAIRTFPFARRVAVCAVRGVVIVPVAVKIPLFGSYSSAVASVPLTFWPPAIRTFPLARSVAVWELRPTLMLPVAANFPEVGS